MTDWKTAFSNTIPGFKRALLWCSLNAIFGLVQILLLVMLGSMAVDPKDAEVYREKLAHTTFRECAIMFFCCAVMGAALTDFILSKVRTKTNVIGFILNVSPVFMILLVVVLYLDGSHRDPAKINLNLYSTFQVIIIAFSSLYCLIVKTYLYLNEKEV